MCVMRRELIRMPDEVLNCSQCIFPQSHGSSGWDSFSLYFTSLYTPVFSARLFKVYFCVVEIDSRKSI